MSIPIGFYANILSSDGIYPKQDIFLIALILYLNSHNFDAMKKMSATHGRTSRLFLALRPEIDVQNALCSLRDAWAWPPGTSLVKPEALHLTLHFLGDVPDTRLPELVHGLKVAVHPFTLSFSHPEHWYHSLTVLEPDSVPDELLQLHATLATALHDLALATETRTYRPHITLARNATGAVLPANQKVQLIQWPVTEYALIKSQDGYSVVQRYAL